MQTIALQDWIRYGLFYLQHSCAPPHFCQGLFEFYPQIKAICANEKYLVENNAIFEVFRKALTDNWLRKN